jgi:hypothetical protein
MERGTRDALPAQVATPDLVYIDSGIQVVVDSETPIFYTDNYYWRYDGDIRWLEPVRRGPTADRKSVTRSARSTAPGSPARTRDHLELAKRN